MNKEQIAAFLGGEYPGYQKFMSDFVVPLFEGAEIKDERGAPQMTGDVKNLAERSGITDVKLCAEIMPSSSIVRVYDVTVKDNVMLRRNRVAVQQLIRKVADGVAAFIAFHHEKEMSEWRFSFCQKFAGTETNAKRYTFLLGPGQNLRTVTANFLSLHKTLQDNGELIEKDYLRCFDVESLSKEFFAKYKAHYEKFCSYVTDGGDANAKKLYDSFGRDAKRVRDYVKKMMGRLVFLQFLQKKGWLGVPVGGKWGEGDRAFLQNLFSKATQTQQADFLDVVLEPMFFNALNNNRTKEGDVFDTKVKAYGCGGKVRIPYLNGGLFTDDNEDDFKSVFPARFFSDAKHKDDPDPTKCGLLDFFAQYNFTIDENDPTEAEVGVDPEMLSCIFENLLEDNKDKGAFYTPKEIVEYMCRQSLVAYLQTGVPEKYHAAIDKFAKAYNPEDLPKKLLTTIDSKLKEVKVCDPAIGSGAFPMGMLRELFFCRVALGDSLAEKPAELKKDIIKNSIYGVDIEKGAVDIARLRFWLSLVVDEETPCALPNLDFKIMQGNSLLENYKGVPLDSLLSDKSIKRRKAKQGRFAFDEHVSYSQGELAFGGQSASDVITSLMKEYYSTDNRDRKQHILDDINAQVKGYIKNQIGNNELHAEIDALECQNDQFFLWHTWFSDVFVSGGFDIVIGNPPYIQLQSDHGKLGKLYKSCGYKTFAKTGDIYCLFYERGWQLLKTNGHLCYITSNKWMRAGYGEATRKFFAEKTDPQILIDFAGEKIFESATVDTNILLFEKNSQNRGETSCCIGTSDCRKDLSVFVKQTATPCAFTSSDSWVILSPIEQSIKRKIESVGTPLKNWSVNIYRGILTGCNEAFIIDENKRAEILAQCADAAERERTEQIIRPILRGRDVKRYAYNWAGLYLLWIPWHFPLHLDESITGASAKAESEFHNQFPAVYRHLCVYKDALSKRNQSETGIRYEWYALQRWGANYWDDFRKPKIVWAETMRIHREDVSNFPRFALATNQVYTDKTCFIGTGESDELKLMLGILNSKVGRYQLGALVSKMDDGGWLMQKIYIERILIPRMSQKHRKRIVSLVDSILNSKVKCTAEHDLDNCIYDVYGLSDDETRHIEKVASASLTRRR